MVVLALDLGTYMGWAVYLNSRTPIISGRKEFKPSRYEGGGMRYLQLRDWLNQMHKTHNGISRIYFEEVRKHSATDAAHVYGGFLAHLSAWCEENKVPYIGIPVTTLKRHATGSGKAKKDDMMAAAFSRGWIINSHDEADARFILDYALSQGLLFSEPTHELDL